MKKRYTQQIEAIGPQVFGRKINKDGFENFWPRFSNKDSLIYFLSNGKRDSGRRRFLYTYDQHDTVDNEKRLKPAMNVMSEFYNIHDSSGMIAFIGKDPIKSQLPPKNGGGLANDAFVCPLPADSDNIFESIRKQPRQVTRGQSIFHASFSPTGNKLAISKRVYDQYYLCIADTVPKHPVKILYPPKNDNTHTLSTIFSLDWSPDGHRIAVCFIDRHDNKIGIYDTLDGSFKVICDSEYDERDPRFSADGKTLYFSSDRTGIFNIYRYCFDDGKLQRLTNVSGGAFAPDVNKEQSKLVYANYDKDGYGIYLIDSVKSLQEWIVDSAMTRQSPHDLPKITTKFTAPDKYSFLPRKLMVMPSLFVEETVTEDNNPFKGRSVAKGGAVLNFFDPLALDGPGNEFGAYLLCEPTKFYKVLDFGQSFFGRETDYDLGMFGTIRALPFTVSASLARRSISGRDVFFDDGLDTMLTLKYNMSPREYDLIASHDFLGSRLNLRAAYNIYEYYVFINNEGFQGSDFSFNPAEGYRLSTYLTHMFRPFTRITDIAPRGLYLKAIYDFWNQSLYNSDRGFSIENGAVKAQTDQYVFHQFTGSLKAGLATPWSRLQNLYLEARATTVQLTEGCKADLRKNNVPEHLPAYYEPGTWVPGYTYYYRDTLKTQDGLGDSLSYDTVLVSGNTLLSGMFCRSSAKIGFWQLAVKSVSKPTHSATILCMSNSKPTMASTGPRRSAACDSCSVSA
jgi:hypothetical protein